MSLLRRCASKLFGLFVDDGLLAALVVGWVVAGCLLLRHWPGAVWTGPAFFVGLAAIFMFGLVGSRR